jgi:hypothetical protein
MEGRFWKINLMHSNLSTRRGYKPIFDLNENVQACFDLFEERLSLIWAQKRQVFAEGLRYKGKCVYFALSPGSQHNVD